MLRNSARQLGRGCGHQEHTAAVGACTRSVYDWAFQHLTVVEEKPLSPILLGSYWLGRDSFSSVAIGKLSTL